MSIKRLGNRKVVSTEKVVANTMWKHLLWWTAFVPCTCMGFKPASHFFALLPEVDRTMLVENDRCLGQDLSPEKV